MRNITNICLTLSLAMMPALALADGGHIGERQGHAHWLGLAAIGAVAMLAVLAVKATPKPAKPSKAGAASEDSHAKTQQG